MDGQIFFKKNQIKSCLLRLKMMDLTLGAQRRPISKIICQIYLKKFQFIREALLEGNSFGIKKFEGIEIVEKEKINC